MRNLGLLLITVGCLLACLVATTHKDVIPLGMFLGALSLGIAGVVVVQVAIRREAQDTGRIEANFQSLDRSLGAIVVNVRKLDEEKGDIDLYDLPARIDATFPEDINTFVEARESISHVWGKQAYADIMSHFAAAERYLNRVWSTSADGYIDEAHLYLTRSREQFEQAFGRLETLHKERPHGGGGAEAASAPSGAPTPTATG